MLCTYPSIYYTAHLYQQVYATRYAIVTNYYPLHYPSIPSGVLDTIHQCYYPLHCPSISAGVRDTIRQCYYLLLCPSIPAGVRDTIRQCNSLSTTLTIYISRFRRHDTPVLLSTTLPIYISRCTRHDTPVELTMLYITRLYLQVYATRYVSVTHYVLYYPCIPAGELDTIRQCNSLSTTLPIYTCRCTRHNTPVLLTMHCTADQYQQVYATRYASVTHYPLHYPSTPAGVLDTIRQCCHYALHCRSISAGVRDTIRQCNSLSATLPIYISRCTQHDTPVLLTINYTTRLHQQVYTTRYRQCNSLSLHCPSTPAGVRDTIPPV